VRDTVLWKQIDTIPNFDVYIHINATNKRICGIKDFEEGECMRDLIMHKIIKENKDSFILKMVGIDEGYFSVP